MRFKSDKVGGYQVFAVSGVNTVSFAIDARDADTAGLLGFAVERHDLKDDERYYMYGFKVFQSVVPNPQPDIAVTTFDQPVQSFVWDDFTAKDGRAYEYFFHPLKGKPKNLDHSAPPIPIRIRTEPLFSDQPHDVFFNRGVGSSQAYTREFNNVPPDKIKPPSEQTRAFEWLSRKLDDAIFKFIADTKRGDTLLCCFYEFHYQPVVDALATALKKNGVDVRIIFDAKKNGKPATAKSKKVDDFPRKVNLAAIKSAKIPAENLIPREAKPSNIQHNKFMVRLTGAAKTPTEVWTGSTNISEGGIFGQTNVGHWVRDPAVAAKYKKYWDLLSNDPGAKKSDDRSTANKKNKALRDAVEAIEDVPVKWHDIPAGITPVFSPRGGSAVLEMYAQMNDEAKDLSCITLAFGINKEFKSLLKDNTGLNHLAFLLLEKEDKPNPKAKDPFVTIDARNNVYKAWGSFLRDPLYQWARETNNAALKLNTHVSYIHSKFLLVDPLGTDPIVVTGSANFSSASTNDNDENMILVRGNKRAADIYFTEFNRLFFHFYFRSVVEATGRTGHTDNASRFLDETDGWLAKYKPGSLKQKRVDVFTRMQGFEQA